MSVIKPDFRPLNLQDLDKSVDRLGDLVKANTDQAGTVDMLKLRQDVERTGDPLLLKQWAIVSDTFERVSIVGTSRDCSGTVQNVTKREDPTALTQAEVSTVLQAIIDAKQRFAAADKNGDGKLQRAEAEAFGYTDTLAAEIGYAAIRDKMAPFEAELAAWAKIVGDCRVDAKRRDAVEQSIKFKSEFHCATPNGAEAAAWGLREMLVKGARIDTFNPQDVLEGAERSLLKNVPLFSTKSSKGHLSDREVKKFLGCDDLRECIAEKKASVARALGTMSYEDWVRGADLPNSQYFKDSDVSKFDNTCR